MFYFFTFFKYFLRILNFLVFTIIVVLISFLPSRLIIPFFAKIYRTWSLLFFKAFGIDEHIHQEHEKPIPNQYILISNHPSGIDVIWLPARFKATPLSKDDIQFWPIIGKITRTAGIIFVKRDKASSRLASLLSCYNAIENGKNILIFPEGGCFGRFLSPFKNGAFEISFKTNTPILPVYVHYEEGETYEWGTIDPFRYIIRLLFKPKNRTAHLYIFDAIYPEGHINAKAYKDFVFEYYKTLEKKYSLQ
jgi:1-acyl-sn-glycerol-3-phosphate acyltransferase